MPEPEALRALLTWKGGEWVGGYNGYMDRVCIVCIFLFY